MNEHEIRTTALLAKYGFQVDEIRLLFRHSRSLARLAEARCNRELTEREEKRDDALETKVQSIIDDRNQREQVDHWSSPVGCGEGCPACADTVYVEVQGDPRGYVVKLKLPGKEFNNWGGEMWGIA